MKFVELIAAVFLTTPLLAWSGGMETPAGGMTIKYLGVQQSGNLAFFDTVEVLAGAAPRNCPYGLYYVDLSTAAGRAIYATLLTTKSAGKKLYRVDWVLNGTGSNCLAHIVVTQD